VPPRRREPSTPLIAVLSDIHGNRHALDAVLREAAAAGADTWWCLGDIVGYGADPRSCVLVAARAERCIAGNHDLGAAGREPLERFADWARIAIEWTRGELLPAGRAALERLEPSDTLAEVPLHHGSARDPVWEYVTSDLQAADLLDDQTAPLVLVGHTHVPAAWRMTDNGTLTTVPPEDGEPLPLAPGRWLVNPGAVGQPRDGDPRAAWALYDPEAGTIEFRRTEYDVAGAQEAIRSVGLPELLAARLAEGM
jgi:diadenosine tetraphosphatase ApaH/serine/threonine PP2A family protein phosphatase